MLDISIIHIRQDQVNVTFSKRIFRTISKIVLSQFFCPCNDLKLHPINLVRKIFLAYNSKRNNFHTGLVNRQFVFLGFFVLLENFSLFGEITVTGEGLQVYDIFSELMSSSGCSLTCHTYCDTGQPCIMDISEDS